MHCFIYPQRAHKHTPRNQLWFIDIYFLYCFIDFLCPLALNLREVLLETSTHNTNRNMMNNRPRCSFALFIIIFDYNHLRSSSTGNSSNIFAILYTAWLRHIVMVWKKWKLKVLRDLFGWRCWCDCCRYYFLIFF